MIVATSTSATKAPTPRPAPRILGPSSPLTDLKGVGQAKAALLAKLGLHTAQDVLMYLPERHEDRSQLIPLRGLKLGAESPPPNRWIIPAATPPRNREN